MIEVANFFHSSTVERSLSETMISGGPQRVIGSLRNFNAVL